MIQHSPSAREPVPAELPTPRAELEIQTGPLLPCGAAPRRMRSRLVSQLVVTLSILGCAVAGATDAVLTVRIAPEQAGLAFAELVLALAAALLIAAYGMTRDRGRQQRAESGQRRARR